MIAIVARVKVQGGKESTFEAEARKMITYVREHEPDTTFYVCLQSTGDPTVFTFYEEYESDEAMTTHGGSEAIKVFFGAIGGILDGQPSIETFKQIDAKR